MEIQRRIDELKRRLRGIRVTDDPVYRVTYNYDATQLRGDCTAVAFPESKDDLVRIVSHASTLDVPLYIRGAGSGFSGGAVPVGSGLVISTEKLSKILSFDPESLTVEVEAGVINGELQRFLEKQGFFYPPDPASLEFSTIGGNVAENSGGPRAFKYGVTRRYVKAIDWLSASGEDVSASSDGMSFLLIGSEGTLGVIYSVTLSVLPLPEDKRTALLIASSNVGAISLAHRIVSSGLVPSVLEFIDSKTILCVAEYCEVAGLCPQSGYLFVEFDGFREDVEAQFSKLEEICRKVGVDVKKARNEDERELLWKLRRSISPSLARMGVTKVNEDISLPLGSLVEGVEFIGELAERLSLDCYIFGHCGDGNLHVNIMTDRRNKEEMKRVEKFVEQLFEKVVELGGSLSGEHGIGITKKRYLRLLMSMEQMELESSIGKAMDPKAILNPGKYFG